MNPTLIPTLSLSLLVPLILTLDPRLFFTSAAESTQCALLDYTPPHCCEEINHTLGFPWGRDAPFGNCSTHVTWVDAVNHCRNIGGRLCTAEEIQNDETHGSGCNYDYELVWSSTPCQFSIGVPGYLINSGWSGALTTEAKNPTKVPNYKRDPTCANSLAKAAVARCCADSCRDALPLEGPRANENQAQNQGVGQSCPSLIDRSGNWSETNSGQTAKYPCLGFPNFFVRRKCKNGQWEDPDGSECRKAGRPNACGDRNGDVIDGVCSCCQGERCQSAATGYVARDNSGQGVTVECRGIVGLFVMPEFPPEATKISVISNPYISEMPANAFTNTANLATLYLAHLNVESLPEKLLCKLPELETIEFNSFGELRSLPPKLLCNSRNLKNIIITDMGVNLKNIPDNFYKVGGDLDVVHIMENRGLESINKDAFWDGNVRKVPKKLKISANRNLRSLYRETLSSTQQRDRIQELNISYNPLLTTIEHGFFEHMNRLSALNIIGNNQLQLNPYQFKGLDHLTSLRIRTTHKETEICDANSVLPNRVFGYTDYLTLPRLEDLELDLPCLTSLNKYTFTGIGHNLKKLKIYGVRKLSSYPSQFLAGIPNLRNLNLELSVGGLTYLGPELFSGTEGNSGPKSIKIFKCKDLTEIRDHTFLGCGSDLTSLIVASNQKLHSIWEYALTNLKGLTAVDFSSNPELKSLPIGVFDSSFDINAESIQISLTDSSITSLSSSTFIFDVRGLPQQSLVYLGGSVLNSCCSHGFINKNKNFVSENLRCRDDTNGQEIDISLFDSQTCCLPPDWKEIKDLQNWNKQCAFDKDSLDSSLQTTRQKFCKENNFPIDDLQRTWDHTTKKCVMIGKCHKGSSMEYNGAPTALNCEPWIHTEVHHDKLFPIGERICSECGIHFCVKCDLNIRQCDSCGPRFSRQTSEKIGTYLFKNETGPFCLDSCPARFYSQEYDSNFEGGKCISCSSPSCLSCERNPNYCNLCEDSHFLLDGTCYSECPPDYYQDTDRDQERLGILSCRKVTVCNGSLIYAEAATKYTDAICECAPGYYQDTDRDQERLGILSCRKVTVCNGSLIYAEAATKYTDAICEERPSASTSKEDNTATIVPAVVVPLLILFTIIFIVYRKRLNRQKREANMRAEKADKLRIKAEDALKELEKKMSGLVSTTIPWTDPKKAEAHDWYWKADPSAIGSYEKSQVLQLSFDRVFVKYPKTISESLEKNYTSLFGKGTFMLDVSSSSVNRTYFIDFDNMTQQNTVSKEARAILRYKRQNDSEAESMSIYDDNDNDVEADIEGEGQQTLNLVMGQLIQIQRKSDGDDMAYGTVIFADTEEAKKTLDDNGWFPLKNTVAPPDPKLMASFNKSLGGDLNALEPPAHWSPQINQHSADYIKLDANSKEYLTLEKLFNRSQNPPLSIINITRIQNVSLFQSYAVKKMSMGKYMTKGQQLEHSYLFHGTHKDTVDKIAQQGFNRSFAGLNMVRFGRGVYFALKSSYSSHPQYAKPDEKGIQRMFMCRILVGHFCMGVNGQRVPDVRIEESHTLYDSTTDNMNPERRQMFVTYHDAQAYPEYIIEFTQNKQNKQKK
eukprot:UC4_evm1s1092